MATCLLVSQVSVRKPPPPGGCLPHRIAESTTSSLPDITLCYFSPGPKLCPSCLFISSIVLPHRHITSIKFLFPWSRPLPSAEEALRVLVDRVRGGHGALLCKTGPSAQRAQSSRSGLGCHHPEPWW